MILVLFSCLSEKRIRRLAERIDEQIKESSREKR